MQVQTNPFLYLSAKAQRLALKSKTWAIESGLNKGRRDYQRFIILTQPRSGSNLLCDLLGSSQQTIAAGEVFQKKRIVWNRPLPKKYLSSEVYALRKKSPQDFVEKIVFRPFPYSVQAVGFKLFYHHVREDETREAFWSYISSMEGLKVIHLRRENFLALFLSAQRATRSRVFIDRAKLLPSKSKPTQPPPTTLDFQECLAAFETYQQQQSTRIEAFKNLDILDITYESLTENYEEEIRRAQEFLGVAPYATYTSMQKQNKQSLSEAIENYEELKQQFQGSQWSSFFID